MINLLPEKQKTSLRQEQLEKLVLIIGSAVLAGLVCLTLILLAVKIYVSGEAVSQKVALDSAQRDNQSAEFLKIKDMISKYNAEITRSSDFYAGQAYMSKALSILNSVQKPEGVYFTAIYAGDDLDNGGVLQMAVSGVSDTRDNLLTFKNNLESETKILSVYFPPESWVNSKNINFNITVRVPKMNLKGNQ